MGEWDHDTRTIWLHHTLTPAQRRCTLAHEFIHAIRGDRACPNKVLDARQENTVRRLTAQLLVPLPRLANALRWSRDDRELAEELNVDVDTVRARREHLTTQEIAQLQELIERLEQAA